MTEQHSPATAQVTAEMVTVPRDGLWAAVVTTDHGTDVIVALTQEKALESVAAFADYWWDEEVGGEVERPTDPKALVEEYFERTADRGESYSVTQVSVHL